MRGIATAVSAANIPGVRDTVPSCGAVVVHVDPLRWSEGGLDQLRGVSVNPAGEAAQVVDVPVIYDGEDLLAVAAHSGLTVADVTRRHAAGVYTVVMTGFAPGFPYLAAVDPRLSLPRLATPRLRVPAGAIGLAAGMTCIYPGGTGGGWSLVGHSDIRLFDPEAVRPATLRPGDQVRFVPVHALAREPGPSSLPPRAATAPAPGGLRVLRPGQLTSVQDGGRWGFQALGVPVSGACEAGARRRANRAVGNADSCAVLEVTAVGPDLRAEEPLLLAWSGAGMAVELDGRQIPAGVAVQVKPGGVVRCGAITGGLRAVVAVRGGLDVPVVLGSRSACLGGAFGGGVGRALLSGDHLPIGRPSGEPRLVPNPWRGGGPIVLRVLPGPDASLLSASVLARLLETPLTVSRHGNRTGCRLSVQVPELCDLAAGERLPSGTVPGAIQCTPAGDLLLLLADRQPTGGYPQVLAVIAADLDVAAQLTAGDRVTLTCCSPDDALRALVSREAALLNGC